MVQTNSNNNQHSHSYKIPSLGIKHFLRGDELESQEIYDLIHYAMIIKEKNLLYSSLLENRTIALIFNKPSLRTRFSFVTGIQAAGGKVVESSSEELHKDKELPRDMIRVLQGYCDALIMRTHGDGILQELASYSKIPIINGLTDNFHPCQILSDFLTMYEHFKRLRGLHIAFIGDGNNILQTFMLMAPKLDITLHYVCPKGHNPHIVIPQTPYIIKFTSVTEAVKDCHVLYTDVWKSMGMLDIREEDFKDFQVNENLMNHAEPNAVFMHCLPMIRGKEVSETLPDQGNSLIFTQSHNRMYAQLALLISLLSRKKNN